LASRATLREALSTKLSDLCGQKRAQSGPQPFEDEIGGPEDAYLDDSALYSKELELSKGLGGSSIQSGGSAEKESATASGGSSGGQKGIQRVFSIVYKVLFCSYYL